MKKTTTITGVALAKRLAAARSRDLAGFFFAMLSVCGGSLHAQSSLNNSSLSNGMLIADFNHDGIPDALVNSPATASLTVSMGSVPYGTFSAAAKFVPYPAGCAMLVEAASVVGDFNGDGFPDLALTCTGGSSKNSAYTVYILLGNGDGTFTPQGSFDGLSNLVAGDFNHDGIADLVAAGSNGMTNGQSVSFYSAQGDGTFAGPITTSLPPATYTSALAVDINQDGYPELALGNFAAASAAETVDIFGNNKNGTFGTVQAGAATPSVSVAVGSNPSSTDQSILAGNFYGTGLVDLAVVDTGATPGIFVIKNTSAGAGYSFANAVKTAYPALVSATAAPFTSLLSDLLVYDGAKLSVLANNGAGAFTAGYATLAAANATTLYAAVDANGDGHADVYTAVPNANGVTLTVDLVSGTASASSAPFSLSAGTKAVSATWAGNVNFAGSTATGSQIVNAIATSVALASSKNPSFAGDSVTFTATVSPLNSGNFVPSGTVTFTDGATVLGAPALGAGGVATVTASALTVGGHTISAVYSGDNIFATSVLTLTQQVNANVPILTWAAPAAITYGTALSGAQLNATAANAGGVNVPGTFTYVPAAGAVLNAGPQTLTVTFTPTDLANYTTATKTVALIVNRATPLLGWTPAVASITYGTALGAQQLNATATGAGGAVLGGSFVYTPASGTVLGAGAQTLAVAFTPTDANYVTANATAAITVVKAAPAISWTAPAAIVYGVPLTATQLNATASGVTGTPLPGSFVYSPAVGAILTPGAQTLNVMFTPTDAVDYAVATASVNLTITDLTLTSFAPNTAQAGDAAKTITITGSGFVASTVAQVNGTNIATTLVNATTLTAIVPAANLLTAATLQISLSNPATGSVSASLPLTVVPAAASGTFSGPSTTPPASQPALNFTLQPYPFDVTVTFTLSAKSALASGVTDPNVAFSGGAGTSYSFVVKANTTTVPTVQIQAGTVAETITITPLLTANGINVTPATLTPINIVVPAAVPSATATALTRNGSTLTVTVSGFSNTREIVQANFHFVPVSGATLSTTDFTAPVSDVFATWFSSAGGLQLGSGFLYTQNFAVVDGDASKIASVQVTLTNSVGVSATATAQ